MVAGVCNVSVAVVGDTKQATNNDKRDYTDRNILLVYEMNWLLLYFTQSKPPTMTREIIQTEIFNNTTEKNRVLSLNYFYHKPCMLSSRDLLKVFK